MNMKVNKDDKQRTIAILGLGYVGLPLALLFVNKGFHVFGIDLDDQKLEKLRNGRSYIHEIADHSIQEAIQSKHFIPTDQYSALQMAEAIVICVPTPLTALGTPDLSYLTKAAKAISLQLKHGQLIILESSTYPGTTREVLIPLLSQSGLKAGSDFHVAYSPERVDPGNKQFPLEKIAKVVSGATPESLARAEELYGKVFNQIHPVASTDTAEMAKILENAYRLVNISFINEMAIACDHLQLNLWEVIEAADTKPFGFKAFYPGPGIGGHCIPVDPSYLLWKMKQNKMNSEFIEIANTINHRMPLYIVQQLKKHLAPKPLSMASVLVYGVAYKPDIADFRESASIGLMQHFMQEGANVAYHDPYIPELSVGDRKLQSEEITIDRLKQTDCVIIATDHSSLPLTLLLEHASFIYDTRNVTGGLASKAKIVTLGAGTGME